jgi:glutathione S-transferase
MAAQASEDSYWLYKERQISEGNHYINLPEIEFINGNGLTEYLSESEAIFLWMVQKSGRQELIPESMIDRVRYAQLAGVIKDIAAQLFDLSYTEKTLMSLKTTMEAKYQSLAKSKLKGLWKILESNDWLMGDKITV